MCVQSKQQSSVTGHQRASKTLNRRFHWGRRGIIYQHDPRHVDVLVKDLVLEHGNSVQTPATHDATEEEEPSQVQYSKYRSQVARCLFLSEDRADTTLVVNELCQRMSSPKQQSLAKLKRLAKHLKRERQWGQIFGCGRLVEEMTTFTDSDWAGLQGTRKLSSAGVIMLGDHALKAHTRQQKIIARSSTEAELYAAAMAASESKEIVSLSRDPGYEMKPMLAIDAMSTAHRFFSYTPRSRRHLDSSSQALRTACHCSFLSVMPSKNMTYCSSSSTSANIPCFSRLRLARPFMIDLHNLSSL